MNNFFSNCCKKDCDVRIDAKNFLIDQLKPQKEHKKNLMV